MSPTSSPSDTSPPQISGKQSLILEAVAELKKQSKLGTTIKIVPPGASADVMTPYHSPPQKKRRMSDYRCMPDYRMFKKLGFEPLTTIPEEDVLDPESDEAAELYTNIDGKRWRVIRHEPAITLCIGCNEERLAYKSACHNIEHAVCISCVKYLSDSAFLGESFFYRCPICSEDVPNIEQRKERDATLLQWMNLTELQCVECSWRGVYENIHAHIECPTSSESPVEATANS